MNENDRREINRVIRHSHLLNHVRVVEETTPEKEFSNAIPLVESGRSYGRPMQLVEGAARLRDDIPPVTKHAVQVFEKLTSGCIEKPEMARFLKSLRLFDHLPPNYQRALGG